MRKANIFMLLILAMLYSLPIQAANETIKIGVLAKRGPEMVMQRWTALADYLEQQLPDFHFTIVPLSFDEIEPAIQEHSIELLLTNSGMYSNLSFTHKLSPIATLKRKILGTPFKQFGSVVLTLAERTDINSYQELRGRYIAAVDKRSLGGWVAAYREMDSLNISIDSLAELDFMGTHDAVVYAVKDKKADAGIVRTDTLERMADEGEINLKNYKTIGLASGFRTTEEKNFPLSLSSRLYPEWPITKLPHLPEAIATKITAILLSLPADSEAAIAAKIMGWAMPLNYREVDRAYSQLKLGAYKNLTSYSLLDVIVRYWKYLLLVFFFLTTVIVIAIYIASLNRDLKITQEKLKQLANTDGLTNLPNRLFFMELAEKYRQISLRENRETAILFLDIDHFKPVNDSFGHDVGDALLVEIAQRIKKTLRGSDLIARIGGDEFLIMLWDVETVKELETTTNRLIQLISMPFVTHEGLQVKVGCSIGISLYSGGKETLDELIKNADLALYQVKKKGRGHFVVFDNDET